MTSLLSQLKSEIETYKSNLGDYLHGSSKSNLQILVSWISLFISIVFISTAFGSFGNHFFSIPVSTEMLLLKVMPTWSWALVFGMHWLGEHFSALTSRSSLFSGCTSALGSFIWTALTVVYNLSDVEINGGVPITSIFFLTVTVFLYSNTVKQIFLKE
jgi:hypothetical protein